VGEAWKERQWPVKDVAMVSGGHREDFKLGKSSGASRGPIASSLIGTLQAYEALPDLGGEKTKGELHQSTKGLNNHDLNLARQKR